MSSERGDVVTGGDRQRQGLLPKLRFPEFRDTGAWPVKPLSALAKRQSKRNSDHEIVRVLTNSAEHGVVDQRDYFEKDIATQGKLDAYFIVEHGDFVYNPRISNTAPVGPIGKNKVGTGVMSPLYTVFRFSETDNTFYEHYFQSTYWHAYLRHASNSGARHDRMAISNDGFIEMPLPVPDSAEQQKIADCLSSLDAVIAAEADRLAALKAHKKSLMQQLFPAEGQTTPRLRFPAFQAAGEWIEAPLGQIADYQNGKAYEPHIVEKGRYAVVNARFISTDGTVRKSSNSSLMIADKGDVLMVLSDLPNGKALAKCFLVDQDDTYAVNQRICRLKPHAIGSEFLLYMLNRHPFLLGFNDGMNQTHLSKDNVLTCPILHPADEAEQLQISLCLASIDQCIAAQTDHLKALKLHKSGLMQQLFPSPHVASA